MGPATFHPRRALVVVLGDLGRSPRMTHHAIALAEAGFSVTLAGYCETPLPERALANPRIEVRELRSLPAAPRDAGVAAFLWRTFRRVALLHWSLAGLLWTCCPRGGTVLAQNPPSLPTLWLCACVARLRGARFVADWHNFGFSLLALRLGRSFAVRWAERYEMWAGGLADGAFCVSEAMRRDLRRRGLRGPLEVVYDRPLSIAPALSEEARRALLRRILPDALPADAVLVCPTSWTADENIELLLEALKLRDCDEAAPRLLVLLTGQGPLRPTYEARIAALPLKRAAVQTHFLSPADYRGLLRAADLGLSLHSSSSGIDLPMKIVDFFGAGTPVLALDYGPCLAELVQDGVQGRTFRDAAGLARLLDEAVRPPQVARFRESLAQNGPLWAEEASGGWRRLGFA
ncbi:MAG: glycosyltransferase [Acidobacteria bacterium]|nr:glycosyltransferase [Acidobacteriota bacterium]